MKPLEHLDIAEQLDRLYRTISDLALHGDVELAIIISDFAETYRHRKQIFVERMDEIKNWEQNK
jgi:hypothetical protein